MTMPADKIGRYEIERELGRGGMAVVYLAHDPNTKRHVALKVLSRQFNRDVAFRERFCREAEVIARLEHSAIVPIYDFGKDEDDPFIVMRYMSGGSLADRQWINPLKIEEAANLFSRLAPALDLAHVQGIVHRDLKPANILFDDGGLSYISDFGIAKIAEASIALTGSAMIGTPSYMSPEQCGAVKDIDGRSDVYALGVMLYQILVGKLPYTAETPLAVAMMHLHDPVPPIHHVRPDLPLGYEHIVGKAMAKKREARYHTVTELATALSVLTLTARAGGLTSALGKAPNRPDRECRNTSVSPPGKETSDLANRLQIEGKIQGGTKRLYNTVPDAHLNHNQATRKEGQLDSVNTAPLLSTLPDDSQSDSLKPTASFSEIALEPRSIPAVWTLLDSARCFSWELLCAMYEGIRVAMAYVLKKSWLAARLGFRLLHTLLTTVGRFMWRLLCAMYEGIRVAMAYVVRKSWYAARLGIQWLYTIMTLVRTVLLRPFDPRQILAENAYFGDFCKCFRLAVVSQVIIAGVGLAKVHFDGMLSFMSWPLSLCSFLVLALADVSGLRSTMDQARFYLAWTGSMVLFLIASAKSLTEMAPLSVVLSFMGGGIIAIGGFYAGRLIPYPWILLFYLPLVAAFDVVVKGIILWLAFRMLGCIRGPFGEVWEILGKTYWAFIPNFVPRIGPEASVIVGVVILWRELHRRGLWPLLSPLYATAMWYYLLWVQRLLVSLIY